MNPVGMATVAVQARRAQDQALQELKLIQAQISLLSAPPVPAVVPNPPIATTAELSPTEKERFDATFQELRDQARLEIERQKGLMYFPPDEDEL